MASPVAELEAGLQAMQGLKPPGVSGSRITSLTALCVANVQSESVLIQKLYTHFKKTPGTHKLGVLYVVDSVTRKWLDQARQQGQAVNGSAPDGTYAAGVNRVTELIPVLMTDILSTAPADQKDKIKKLVDIWEKGQTFSPQLIESFKEKLNASASNVSTTPPGSPPPNVLTQGAAKPAAPAGPPALPPNIMETLANLAKQSSSAAAPLPATATPPTLAAPFGQQQQQPPAQPPQQYGQQPPPFQMPPAQQQQQQTPFPGPYGASGALPGATAPNSQLPPALAGLAGLIGAASQQQPHQPPPPQPQPQPGAAPNVQQNLMFIQALLAQGLSLDQISGILAQVGNGAPATGGPPSLVPSAIAAAAAAAGAGGAAQAAPQWPPNNYGGRSPGRGRSRSRSPGRHWDGRSSPRGRDHHGHGGGRDYRQRSPPGGGRRSPRNPEPPSPGSKFVEHDPSLPENTIRVLSRTLFVGGVNIPESELRAIFTRFGDVQTCIVNKEKRHAFVKMYTRADAEAAKDGMEHSRGADDLGLRTRWGVGFGPRDCSDYSKGVSIIPITKLTEADRKWLLTAPWGGSGGRPIATGLVVEEPDIEIGAGVSSKAISRRMQTDRGGVNGPRSTRREEEMANANSVPINPRGGRRGDYRGDRNDRGSYDRRGNGSGAGDELNYGGGGGPGDSKINNGNGAAPPAGFPFGLTMGANGMPVFPPGFQFPAPE
ncbi:protein NRD1 [Sporothrix brasiliensis 5110]|uniref:Protein NRD1 n=1 Tax=Sporothrix brasiliensis 5110 TaxID=1398154 RepID=A0A0C2EXZ0_9PEZI|nr:protein NRD1 [Sporothrix brasiliensis 5110]KIH91554.1 protein NRD1 [Sporothrix brasiliensis 5110]